MTIGVNIIFAVGRFGPLKNILGTAWLAQSEEQVTLALRVMSSSPTMGVEIA